MQALEKFHKIEEHFLQNGEYWLNFDKSPFHGSFLVDYYYYPEDIHEATNGLVNHFLKMAKCSDLYEPLEKLMKNAGVTPPPKEEMVGDNNWTFTMISLGMMPPVRNDLKKYLRIERMTFIVLPFINNGEREFQMLFISPTTGNIFVEMTECKLADEENEEHVPYIKIFSEAIDFICEKLGIDENEKEDISEDDALSEFISLTMPSGQNDEEFKRRYYKILNEPKECMKILSDEGYAAPNDEFDPGSLKYLFLLLPLLNALEMDWQIDNEELGEYISDAIGKKFKLPNKYLEPYEIAEKLEKKSEYTLLNIETQMDAYCFFVCKKEDKKRILKLAKILDFEISGF